MPETKILQKKALKNQFSLEKENKRPSVFDLKKNLLEQIELEAEKSRV